MTAINCPTCKGELKPVIQPPHLDFDKFAADKAGDFYCEVCPALKGKGYRHFWTHQLQPKEPMIPQYTLKEIISFKLAGLPETKDGVYWRVRAEKWLCSKIGNKSIYEIPAKYTEGRTLPAPTHKPGIAQDPERAEKKNTKVKSVTARTVAVTKTAPSPFENIDLALLGLVTVKLSQWESKNGQISTTKRNEVTHLMYDYASKSQDHVQATDFVLKVLS